MKTVQALPIITYNSWKTTAMDSEKQITTIEGKVQIPGVIGQLEVLYMKILEGNPIYSGILVT